MTSSDNNKKSCQEEKYLKMASSACSYRVVLQEDDVPGAALKKGIPIDAHSCTELKRWLQCRNVKISGRKKDLIERVKLSIANKIKISNSIDRGVWYDRAKAQVQIAKPTQALSAIFPITSWKKFPSRPIPSSFCYGVIHKHIIETARVHINSDDSDKENECVISSGTSKPLRKGRKLFLSGHVKDLQDNVTTEGHYSLKCVVLASFDETIRNVMIILHKELGDVLDSTCDCAASALGRCSHVASVLFALDDYVVQFGYAPVSCTSQLCKWNVGRQSGKKPQEIYKKTYDNKKNPEAMHLFMNDINNNDNGPSHYVTNSFLSSFQGMDESALWLLMLDYHYENYILSVDMHLVLLEKIKQFQQALSCNHQRVGEVPNTIGQSKNPNWLCKRKLYVTASKAKDIFNMSDITSKQLQNMLWNDTSFSSKYTDHGKTNEKRALAAYQDEKKCTILEAGLCINPKYPGLACSPDGLITEDITGQKGLLEIKCPYVLKNEEPNALETLTKSQRYNFCCNLDTSQNLVLKKDHKYYYQIQMSMAILELDWCDFVVYTFKGMHCQRITFDDSLWNKIYPKLQGFHFNVLSPEYFEMRTVRNLAPMVLK